MRFPERLAQHRASKIASLIRAEHDRCMQLAESQRAGNAHLFLRSPKGITWRIVAQASPPKSMCYATTVTGR